MRFHVQELSGDETVIEVNGTVRANGNSGSTTVLYIRVVKNKVCLSAEVNAVAGKVFDIAVLKGHHRIGVGHVNVSNE